MTTPRPDGGFVLLDALVAVVLVSAAGAATYVIGMNLLEGQESRLDRSVGLFKLYSLATELQLTSAPGPDTNDDGVFVYEVRQEHDTGLSRGLVVTSLVARPKSGGSELTVTFLAPPVSTR